MQKRDQILIVATLARAAVAVREGLEFANPFAGGIIPPNVKSCPAKVVSRSAGDSELKIRGLSQLDTEKQHTSMGRFRSCEYLIDIILMRLTKSKARKAFASVIVACVLPLCLTAGSGCGVSFDPLEWKPFRNVDKFGYVSVDIKLVEYSLHDSKLPIFLRFSSDPRQSPDMFGEGWSLSLHCASIVPTGQYSYLMTLPNFNKIEFYQVRDRRNSDKVVSFDSASGWKAELSDGGSRFEAIGSCSSRITFKDGNLIKLTDGNGISYHFANNGGSIRTEKGEVIGLRKYMQGFRLGAQARGDFNPDVEFLIRDNLLSSVEVEGMDSYKFEYILNEKSNTSSLRLTHIQDGREKFRSSHSWSLDTGFATEYEYQNKIVAKSEKYQFLTIPGLNLEFPLVGAKDAAGRQSVFYKNEPKGISVTKEYAHADATYERFSTASGQFGLLRERSLLNTTSGESYAKLGFRYDLENRLTRILRDGEVAYIFNYDNERVVMRTPTK